MITSMMPKASILDVWGIQGPRGSDNGELSKSRASILTLSHLGPLFQILISPTLICGSINLGRRSTESFPKSSLCSIYFKTHTAIWI